MTPEQANRLRILTLGANVRRMTIDFAPFDLPQGYLYVVVEYRQGAPLHTGIAPDGTTNS